MTSSRPAPTSSAGRPELDRAVSTLAAALPGAYLLLTSTTNLVPGVAPYDAKRMLQFGLLFLLFLLPALNRRVRAEFGTTLAAVPAWIGWTTLAVFALGMLSAMVNANSPMHLANSVSEVALLGSLVLGVFVIAACRRIGGRGFDRTAIGILALTGLTVGAQELLGVVAAHAAGTEFSYSLSLLHFAHPRFFNQLQSWIVPVIVALPLVFSRYPLARWLCLIILALHWYILLMTAGRGSLVGLIAALAFSSLFLPACRRTLITWQVAGLLLGSMLYGVILFSFGDGFGEAPAASSTEQAPPRSSSTESTAVGTADTSKASNPFFAESLGRPMAHTSGRSWMWSATWRDSLDHPLLGIGPMNYACTSKFWFGHPHNFPLQITAEWGLPAAAAAFVIALFLLLQSVRAIRRGTPGCPDDARVAGLLFTGVLAASIHACFSGILVMPASQVTGLVTCGLLLGLISPAFIARYRSTAQWLFLPGLLLTVSLMALGGQEIRTTEDRAAHLPPGRLKAPRMWQDSKLCRLYLQQQEVTN